jgi:hypothetical protein
MTTRRTSPKAVPSLEVEKPKVREVTILSAETIRKAPPRSDGLPGDVPDGYVRVYALANVFGIAANHWGDVKKTHRHLEVCLRKHLVLLEGPDGEPAPAALPARSCCGYSPPGQH